MYMCNIGPVTYAFINRACRRCKRGQLRVHVLKEPLGCSGVSKTYCAYVLEGPTAY